MIRATGPWLRRAWSRVNHDHFFNFRLDLDVDGEANILQRDVYALEMLPANLPRRSVYVYRPERLASEGGIDTGHTTAKYRVVNAAKTNAVGNPVSYELLYANHAPWISASETGRARRATFLQARPLGHALRAGTSAMPAASTCSQRGAGRPAGLDRAEPPDPEPGHCLWVNLGMHHVRALRTCR